MSAPPAPWLARSCWSETEIQPNELKSQLRDPSSENRPPIDEEGYTIVQNSLDCKEVERLTETADRLIQSDLRISRQIRDKGNYDGFLSLLLNETVFPMVVQFLGAYLHLLTSHLSSSTRTLPALPLNEDTQLGTETTVV